MYSILLTLLIIVAVIMVLVILLQKSEGGGMSGSQAASMFGGALTGAAAGNFLTKLTAWLATIFFAVCAVLALLVSKQSATGGRQSDVRDALIQNAQPAPEPVAAPLPSTMEVVEESEPEPEVPEVPEN